MQVKGSSWRQRVRVIWHFRGWKVWAIIGVAVVLLVGASWLVSMPPRHMASSGATSSAAADVSGSSSGSTESTGTTSVSSGPASSGPASGFATSSSSMAAGSSTASTGTAEASGAPSIPHSALHSSSASSASASAIQSKTSNKGAYGAKDQGAASLAASLQTSTRMVIESANLDMTVSNLTKADSEITSLTTGNGGFIQTMHQSTDSQGQNFETIALRIPENQFQSVLDNVKGFGTVNTFSQSGQDVTTQHNNMQQQLSELQNEAAAYTRLFDKATTMADMLQIQQSLTQVNSEIANLNSQMHQLDHSVQYATLNVSLHEKPVPAPVHKQPVQPLWSPAMQSLHLMQRLALGLSRVLAWVLPWVILIGLFYGGVRLGRRGWRMSPGRGESGGNGGAGGDGTSGSSGNSAK